MRHLNLFNLALTLGGAAALLGGCRQPMFLRPVPIEPSALAREEHAVSAAHRLDVLWVVDNSLSIEKYRAAIVANAEAFVNSVMTAPELPDWRIGLISTDPSEAPRLGFTPETTIGPTTENAALTFRNAVHQMGSAGTNTESGFESVIKTLKANDGFLRPQASLMVVFVTEEHEQSPEMNDDAFLAELTALKGRPDLVSFAGAFGGPGLECAGGAFMDWDPFKILFQRTEGKSFPICSPSFGTDLATALTQSKQFGQLQGRITLASRPVPGTIAVTFDGRDVPARTATEDGYWTYDYDRNAIVFHRPLLGSPDATTVQVTYKGRDHGKKR